MNNNQLPIETLNELLKLRNLLHVLNQQTFAYSEINKRFPIGAITEEDAHKIIDAYQNIVDTIKKQLADNEQ